MFRDLPGEYAYDSLCLISTKKVLESGIDGIFYPVERQFLYLPLMHSEDLADQELSLRYYTELRNTAPAPLRGHFELTLDFACRHKSIIDRFGRYPYRNDQLGRETTADEAEFLRTPGSGF